MAVQHTQAVQQLSSAARRTESRPSVIGPISLDWPHLKGNHGNVFKWLLWTGCRLNEAAGMRAGEVTGDVWTIPAARAKNGRARAVPLPSQAINLLHAVLGN